MRPTTCILLLLTLVPGGNATAQASWHLTFERAATTFSAEAHDSSTTDRVHIRPWHPTIYSLRLIRQAGRLGIGVGIGYSSAAVAGNIGDFVLQLGDRERLVELAPELRYRLGATATGASWILHAGPLLDIWTPEGGDGRTVWGAAAGATLAIPIGTRWAVDVRTDFGITAATVTEAETSAELIRENSVRRGRLALGITRRL